MILLLSTSEQLEAARAGGFQSEKLELWENTVWLRIPHFTADTNSSLDMHPWIFIYGIKNPLTGSLTAASLHL